MKFRFLAFRIKMNISIFATISACSWICGHSSKLVEQLKSSGEGNSNHRYGTCLTLLPHNGSFTAEATYSSRRLATDSFAKVTQCPYTPRLLRISRLLGLMSNPVMAPSLQPGRCQRLHSSKASITDLASCYASYKTQHSGTKPTELVLISFSATVKNYLLKLGLYGG